METYIVRVNGEEFEVEIEKTGGDEAPAAERPASRIAQAAKERREARKAGPASKSGRGEPVAAGTSGKVFKVVAHEGQEVKTGDTIVVLEAMKMEIPVVSPKDGKISKIVVSEGEAMASGQTVAYVE